MTTLLQELINFKRKKKPEVSADISKMEIKPIAFKAKEDPIKDPVVSRIYREMRKAYQRIVASPNRKYNAEPEALKLVYDQLSKPLQGGNKDAFIRVMNKWPADPEQANAYSEIMGRLLNSLGIEDVDFEDSEAMWDRIEDAVDDLDDDEEVEK